MKKLSDYRIREENGKFYIEKQVTETFGLFKKKTITEWFSVDKWGYPLIPINSEFFNGRMVLIEDHSKPFDTLEAAKAQIIKWCEEPKYHYVREFEGYSYSPNFSKGCPCDFADFHKEQLSRADIEYLAKCRIEEQHIKNAIYFADLDNILFVMMDKDDFIKSLGLTKEELFDELNKKYVAQNKTKK